VQKIVPNFGPPCVQAYCICRCTDDASEWPIEHCVSSGSKDE